MVNETDLSPYLDHSRSSKAPIYGMPAAVASVIWASSKLPTFIEKVSREFQEDIRKRARASWGDVADTIFVAYDNDTGSLRIFSLDPRARDLEYGTINVPPRPILRNAAYSAQTMFAEKLSQAIHEAIS